MVSSGIDFVERLVKCKGDVSSFLEFNSLLDLCGSFLKVKVRSQGPFLVSPENFSGRKNQLSDFNLLPCF